MKVPKAVADQDYQLFPEGVYAGTFVFNTDNNNGEAGTENWRFSLRVGFTNLKPVDNETPDPDGRPFSSDIVVVWDGVSLTALDDEPEKVTELPFPAAKGLSLLCQLGEVMGAAQRDEDGNVIFESLGTFVDEVRAHKYDGRPIAVQVSHYTPKGQKQARDQIGGLASID